LERNRLIQEKWYKLYIERIHLLVPAPAKEKQRQLCPGDVVLFVFQDSGMPKMWVWRLGVVVRQVSRSTYELRYVNQGGGKPRLIERDARHISLVYGLDELPPSAPGFFHNL
jgi:hypothetical protein